ncbi:C40 family peptidase [Agromyces aerolatus]|uniref:C40 family peptidase n=1 Tax=Agromyces sp. LY-1074 TaxID=3074080 RepID=UPI00285E88A2|nr:MULTISPECIES: C40 family peptidase [unclassified Agromyces]MDR5698493.1 C40 family peptidase [Agromyces sp. LY-1074]MDR5704787.1 C40 family peptidase [Agromyces sp. LY-1358]
MAEHRTRPVSRVKPATVFSTVAIGAVTASIGLAGGPAYATPDYPSWGEIEQAKQNEQTKQAEITRLGELLDGLRATADAAVQASRIADEKYRNTLIARDSAQERADQLGRQAEEAQAVAELSRMRAGLMAAHLAKRADGGLTTELAFSGDPDGLLKQLGTASKLGERSQALYDQALADKNSADALGDQAKTATAEREKLAKAAEEDAAASQRAAAASIAAVTEQERRSAELYEQLALLKDTTAALERERVEGQQRAAAEEAMRNAPPVPAPAPAPAPAPGGGGGGSAPAPAPVPVPVPNPSVPNQGAVETAIGFASAQLGKWYASPGDSVNTWDCSGLTRAAYGAAGIYIGTHSATNQYFTLANQGKAISVRDAQRGDLLFWGGGGSYYHVAIYLGGGQILEAPDYGKTVRIWPIWGSPSAAARPAG